MRCRYYLTYEPTSLWGDLMFPEEPDYDDDEVLDDDFDEDFDVNEDDYPIVEDEYWALDTSMKSSTFPNTVLKMENGVS